MKIKLLALSLVALVSSLLISCQDDMSSQGSSLIKGEVTITVDSIPTFVPARSVTNNAYDSRSVTKLLGRINVPEYGSLNCSLLTQLYPSPSLNINDTIPESQIDSIKLIAEVPRGSLTGDSLAPQQMKVYRLNRQLPADIVNSVNPIDYYNPDDPDALIGSQTYALTALNKSDSAFIKNPYISIKMPLPREKALECVRKYRTDPSIFQWPQTFAQQFPGIYLQPSFGNGCIGNIQNIRIFLYYHNNATVNVKDEETEETVSKIVTVKDSTCVFTSAPEVISSNVIDLKLSDNITNIIAEGKSVITTPGGYIVDIDFPAQEIIDKYKANNSMLTVISNLSMEIPAKEIENDYGIKVAPYLLMIKKTEIDNFFNNNLVPDEVTSFYAPYDKDTKSYSFKAMRTYILNLINSGKELTPEDTEFSLIPVDLTTESVEQYGGGYITYVIRCSNYIAKPTMTILDTDNAIINFTYSKQEID